MAPKYPQKLYIIGNGFDLHHKLKTKYSDFRRFTLFKDIGTFIYLSTHFNFPLEDRLWCSFENDLGNFNPTEYYENRYSEHVGDEELDYNSGSRLHATIEEDTTSMISNIKECFGSWIESINYPRQSKLKKSNKLLDLKTDSTFLTFNLTHTLEILYNIPLANVFHVHGSVGDDYEDIVIGHGSPDFPEEPVFDDAGEPTRHAFTDAQQSAHYPYYAFKKDHLENMKHCEAFNRRYDEIIVLGHSLSNIDLPYFIKILANNPNVIWKITWHTFADIHRIEVLCKELNLPASSVALIKVHDLAMF